jgi:VCBS repeat-containing protein
LSGIAAGTAVNLSFDLIGFGNDAGSMQSHLTVRDVKLSGATVVPKTQEDAVTGAEDSVIPVSVLANDSDAGQAGFVPKVVAGPAHGRVELNVDGSFSYTPDADFFGQDRFTYTISNGRVDSNESTVNLTVTAVNDAPVVSPFAAVLQEDGSVILNLQGLASDVDGDPLQISLSTPQQGSVTRNANGEYVYTPVANFNGEDSFIVTASDGQLTAGNIVRLTITAMNDIAVAGNDTAMTDQGKAVLIAVLANDTDIDNSTGVNAGLGLAANAGLLAKIIANPAHGSVTQTVNGSLLYTPDVGFYGTDSFSYVANDGVADSNLVGVTLTVNPTNRPPVAHDDSATLNENGSIRLGLLANDADADGDALSIILETQPTHGKLVLNADNTVTYTPFTHYSGADSFSYRLSDGQALSGIATALLTINPIANAPTLVLTETSASFRTSWETVANTDSSSTVLKQSELEGWKLMSNPNSSNNGFEVWSSGDKLTNSSGKLYTVNAGKDNGNNWLKIGGSPFSYTWQVAGIERSVQTMAGAIYNLSLDLAALRGYGADYARVNIVVDDQKIGTWAGASYSTSLNWQNLALQFTGNGQRQTLKIVSEGPKNGVIGQITMLDDIVLSEWYPANTGLEDTAIRLAAISAQLADTDGSETLRLSIENLPVGAVLTDGSHQFTAGPAGTTADITGWAAANLSVTPPNDFNGSFSLKVTATAKEQLNGDQASTVATLKVTVLPVNDAPIAKDAGYTVQQDSRINIDFAGLISDADGDALTLSLAHPSQGVLKKNSDGSYTYEPNPGFNGVDSFSYTVSDGSLSSTATISLRVAGPAVNKSASITLQSSYAVSATPVNNGGGVTAPVTPAFTVDWQGSVANQAVSSSDEWLIEYLAKNEDKQKTLAEMTGLTIKL